jgi:prophage regulatory protein
MSQAFLRLPQVKARTGLSRSLIYDFIKNNRFPKQVALGDRAVGWVESEVNGWVEDRINESRREHSS